jgi:hypothetical protein
MAMTINSIQGWVITVVMVLTILGVIVGGANLLFSMRSDIERLNNSIQELRDVVDRNHRDILILLQGHTHNPRGRSIP